MKLERHSVWSIYDDRADNLEKFIENFVPDMKLRMDVAEDVIKAYKVIRGLLIHSYYEYEFVDVAVSKLLHTFEMALKIRHKDLTNEEWPEKRPLAHLIELFRNGGYFEINHKDFFDYVRNARNAFSHPRNHSFGGIALFHWFDTITDLINDLYEDVGKRRNRLEQIRKLNENIREVVNKGAIINLITKKHLIYEAGILFLEETCEGTNYLFYFKRLFELNDKAELKQGQKQPFQIMELKNFSFEFVNDGCKIGLFSISKITEQKEKEKERLNDWIAEFQRNSHYAAYDSFLGFEIQKYYEKKRREVIHSEHFFS